MTLKVFQILLIVLCVVMLFVGCQSQVAYDPDTVLTYRLKGVDVQVKLTEDEAKLVAGLFNGKKIERWFNFDEWKLEYYEYGCPFDRNVTITIGSMPYYIGYDGCGIVRIGEGEDVPYIELTYEEDQQLVELFRKYTGLEHPY